MKKLHIGCGMNAPEDFDNYDASPTLKFERIPILGKLYTKNATRFPENAKYGSIISGLFVDKNSYDLVYCSHVLEHLSKDEFYIALKNIYSYLKPNGIFRVIMPDLNQYTRLYLDKYSSNSETSSIDFMNDTLLGIERVRKRNFYDILKNGLSNSRHIWLWDDISTRKVVSDIGFINIERKNYMDSGINGFDTIEKEGSFNNAFCLECTK